MYIFNGSAFQAGENCFDLLVIDWFASGFKNSSNGVFSLMILDLLAGFPERLAKASAETYCISYGKY